MAQIQTAASAERTAHGKPGLPPKWSNSAKAGVGTALNAGSRVWFTLADGIVTEVFYPQIDTAAIRDLQFLVADEGGFFSEQRKDTHSKIEAIAPGVPAYHLKSNGKKGRYSIEEEILTDPRRTALLLRVRFDPGNLVNPKLYVLLAPHLANHGMNNNAWVGNFKGDPLLFARAEGMDGPSVLALGCSRPFRKLSAGYVGISDGWQDVSQHGRMEWEFTSAPDGNVALTAELDIDQQQPTSFELALGFGNTFAGAAQNVRAAMIDGFDGALDRYTRQWTDWQGTLKLPHKDGELGDDRVARVSTAVLRTNEAKEFAGAMVASFCTPWGESRGDNELGYHMVWTRDLIESVGGLIAVGAHDPAREGLTYLHATQESDGHWVQNMFVEGRPHWTGTQMDEIGFPILLAFTAAREPTLSKKELASFWPSVKTAALFIMQHGPVTPQDRWEQFSGYSTFSIAVEISALLAAAEHAARIGETGFAIKARSVADDWNSKIEQWTYVTGTELARKFGVEGYYAFVIPAEPAGQPPGDRPISLPHRPSGDYPSKAGDVVSPDALALVRFGLRSPHDPRIANTIKVIDGTLKVDTPSGPCWRRFIGDAYGESDRGEPFQDGEGGRGRAWPLLTGERAHFELAAGNRKEAIRLMHAMEAFANDSGLIPEQIWDAKDIPEKGLFFGKPTGSAMPLAWAHAEYLKLRRSIADGKIFDMPPETASRYISGNPKR